MGSRASSDRGQVSRAFDRADSRYSSDNYKSQVSGTAGQLDVNSVDARPRQGSRVEGAMTTKHGGAGYQSSWQQAESISFSPQTATARTATARTATIRRATAQTATARTATAQTVTARTATAQTATAQTAKLSSPGDQFMSKQSTLFPNKLGMDPN